jgi:hypothetical protein
MKAPRQHSDTGRGLTTLASLAFNGHFLQRLPTSSEPARSFFSIDFSRSVSPTTPPIRSVFPILPAAYSYRIGKDETSDQVRQGQRIMPRCTQGQRCRPALRGHADRYPLA